MRHFRLLLAAVALVGALALTGAGLAIDSFAARQTGRMLAHSGAYFVQMFETALDGVLWYAASMAAYWLDYSAEPQSVAKMRQLAEMLYVDEVTVVTTNGVAVASNYPEYVGFDWHTTRETAAYLKLFAPDHKTDHLIQPFRPCVIQHDNYRKFGAVVFTNRLALVQVGYSMERLIGTLALSNADAFRKWKFGRHGRFGAVDADADNIPDVEPPGFSQKPPSERVERVRLADGVWHRMAFPFAGRLFYAEVPDREFGEQRNTAFAVAAVVIAVLMSLFTLMLVLLRRSARRVAKLHEAADRRTAADLDLAHTIQMSTLPRAAAFNPECLAYDLDAVMVPAREVGGDLYDVFALADGRVAFVIGDVSGKGVPAAMFMLVAKNAIRQALHGQGDPAVAMAAANAALCAENEAAMFVTMILGVLDPASGEVTYVNAGHNRPYVLRADGAVERLEVRGGRLLGLFADLEYRAAHLRLEAGDRLFLYTDGVTEAQDAARRLYGEERLESLLASRPDALCAAVRADVVRHVAGAPASDDLTMFAISWNGRPDGLARTFPADEASLRPALDFLRQACPLASSKRFARLLQVADELVSNVIAYSGSPSFALEVETGRDRCKFVLSDAGRPYNPLAQPEPDVHAPIAERPIGGLGVFLARRFSDFIRWRYEEGRNRLTVVLYLK